MSSNKQLTEVAQKVLNFVRDLVKAGDRGEEVSMAMMNNSIKWLIHGTGFTVPQVEKEAQRLSQLKA